MENKQTSINPILEARIKYIIGLNGGEMTYGELLKQMRNRGWALTEEQERKLK